MRSAARGDEDAITSLYRRFAPLARGVALRILQDADEAEDIVQDTFYAVLLALKAGRGPRDSAAGYVHAVARRLAQRQQARSESLVRIGLPIPEPRYRRAEDCDAAAAALASLPRRWRAILWLIEVEGYAPTELAPLMAISPTAVSSLATRARRAFRSAYPDHSPRRSQPRRRLDAAARRLPAMSTSAQRPASAAMA
ncbi:RNA polymerase sigma factor [Jiangella aurantiaca]|uniref:RNA polymerase sigma factor n=1 Tax=Jiangella aurantiaca TaxID=2530373 RepID=UPI0013A5D4CA|nr:sigma-70 family RNA polymerase sigma factor [Jiangella aurantiaca]